MPSQLQYTPITTGTLAASPTGLSRDGFGVVSVVLSVAPVGKALAVGTIVNVLGVGNFNGSYSIATLTDQQHWTYQQSASLGVATGGGGTIEVSPAQFSDLRDSALDTDKAVTSGILDQLSHNAYFGAVRCEVFNMGYWGDGAVLLPPQSPVDKHQYDLTETLFIPILGSGRQPVPAGQGFTPGQMYFPLLANSDVGRGFLVLSPYKLYVDSTGHLNSQLYFNQTGLAKQGAVQVIAVCQRLAGSLVFLDGAPVFTDLRDSLLTGNNWLGKSKIRAVNWNAKFGMVRLEVFNKGYYADGNTVGLPVSPVDSYAYARSELIYLPVLGSCRQPTGLTPGQTTFPALASSDTGTGNILEMPYQLSVNGATGAVTVKMYFSQSGLASQGTVQVIVFAQRRSVQKQL